MSGIPFLEYAKEPCQVFCILKCVSWLCFRLLLCKSISLSLLLPAQLCLLVCDFLWLLYLLVQILVITALLCPNFWLLAISALVCSSDLVFHIPKP